MELLPLLPLTDHWTFHHHGGPLAERLIDLREMTAVRAGDYNEVWTLAAKAVLPIITVGQRQRAGFRAHSCGALPRSLAARVSIWIAKDHGGDFRLRHQGPQVLLPSAATTENSHLESA